MVAKNRSLRLALTLVLWGLLGVALVVLPGLLAQNPSTSAETPVTSSLKTSITTTSTGFGPETRTQPVQQSSTAGDFLVRLVIIVVPAVALSALGGTWVSKRVRRAAV